ncbi:MAG: single-stranded DNA-binding protein [Bacteroidales bacterium]|nr:single-stranded DNA-binding protein [Bacteroidales bacterium]
MNLTILVGRTTKDIEIRTTASGTTVANFTLAVDRYSKGEKTADFISCVAYNKTAELLNTYVSKGQRIGIVGRISTGSYQNKNGDKVYTTDVIVNEVEFLEPKKKAEDTAADLSGFDEIPDDFPFV